MFKAKMISVEVQTNLIFNQELSKKSGWNSPYPEKIKIHSLCSWSNIINVLTKEEIIPNKDIDDLKIFLKNPKKWREFNE